MKLGLFLLPLFLLLAQSSQAAAGGEPTVGFVVQLSVPGAFDAFAGEIANLGSETEVIENQVLEPGGQTVIRKIPGRVKWLDVTLKRGLTSSLDLANWRKLVTDGNVTAARKDVAIIVFDNALNPVARWNLKNAWPSMISLEQKPDGTPVEVLRLVHEGMTRVKP